MEHASPSLGLFFQLPHQRKLLNRKVSFTRIQAGELKTRKVGQSTTVRAGAQITLCVCVYPSLMTYRRSGIIALVPFVPAHPYEDTHQKCTLEDSPHLSFLAAIFVTSFFLLPVWCFYETEID